MLISYFFSLRHRSRKLSFKTSLISKFKKRLINKNRFRQKIKTDYSDFLMGDPNRDINISIWDKESLLREKADIHRARLSKYGSSKLNGELFFREDQGKVYKYNSDGEKHYI